MIIIDPIARIMADYVPLKSKSLLFPGIKSASGILVLNLFTAAALCFCGIPSFLVYYWKLPKSCAFLVAGGSLAYHMVLSILLSWNWFNNGDPMGFVLDNESNLMVIVKHLLGIGIHVVMSLGFLAYFADGKGREKKE
jgi:hypothetical protein